MGQTPAIPPDPRLPHAAGLLLDEGRQALRVFLEARRWEPEDARPVQVMYRPGRSCVVRHRVLARNPSAEHRVLTLCAETARRPEPAPLPPESWEGRYDLAAPIDVVGPYLVWAFPYDPTLTGLPDAAFGPAVRQALGRIGPAPAAVSVVPLRYRPRRRAVFRYLAVRDHAKTVRFGKVLRPKKAARLRRTGESLLKRRRSRRRPGLRLALPAGWEGDDAALFEPLEGRSLLDLILAGDSLPHPRRLVGLSEEIAALPAAVEENPAPERLVEHARGLLVAIVPEASAQVERVAALVRDAAARDTLQKRVVHGDFYEAQVFVEHDYSLGLLDLDDLGLGDPGMEVANLSAHLLALALSAPHAKARLLAYRNLVLDAYRDCLDLSPADMAWREALVMLMLASGPFRTARPSWPSEVARRVSIAERLLEPA